jgi:hypothetical protein
MTTAGALAGSEVELGAYLMSPRSRGGVGVQPSGDGLSARGFPAQERDLRAGWESIHVRVEGISQEFGHRRTYLELQQTMAKLGVGMRGMLCGMLGGKGHAL